MSDPYDPYAPPPMPQPPPYPAVYPAAAIRPPSRRRRRADALSVPEPLVSTEPVPALAGGITAAAGNRVCRLTAARCAWSASSRKSSRG